MHRLCTREYRDTKIDGHGIELLREQTDQPSANDGGIGVEQELANRIRRGIGRRVVGGESRGVFSPLPTGERGWG